MVRFQNRISTFQPNDQSQANESAIHTIHLPTSVCRHPLQPVLVRTKPELISRSNLSSAKLRGQQVMPITTGYSHPSVPSAVNHEWAACTWDIQRLINRRFSVGEEFSECVGSEVHKAEQVRKAD